MIFVGEVMHQRIPMRPVHPAVFDQLMAEGWRFLGDSIIRHNSVLLLEHRYWTIPLRIGVPGLEFSASQRKVLRRHLAAFQVKTGPIVLNEEREALFLRHCERFDPTHGYTSLDTFITAKSGQVPVRGYEIEVRQPDGRLVACSYFHTGATTASGTYCFFDPDVEKFSLGTFTMLFELLLCQEAGVAWYYPGYAYSTPSQFDYKLNFHNLEAYDWQTGQWSPRVRKVVGPRAGA
jgi:leucyl-tRNA---protein transferase